MVANSFDPKEAKSIEETQKLFYKLSLSVGPTYILVDLAFIQGAVTQLKEAGQPLSRYLSFFLMLSSASGPSLVPKAHF